MITKNRVGLGTFPLASVFSNISKKEAKNVIRQYILEGGFYIDTAPMYGFGEVETLLGEVLKEFKREQFYLITKCGYINVEGKTFQTLQRGSTYDDVLRECELSLKRLNLDYIDLYFVHSPDPITPFEETMGALIQLQKEGKIKEIGVSNVNLDELKKYDHNNKVKYLQNRFSLINRSIEPELESYLLQNNIGLIPYQVIDRGQLTGSVFEGVKLNDTDLRKGKSDWLPEKYNIIAQWSKENLYPIAQRLGITLGQLSIAWALQKPYLSFVIVGVTKLNYIPINLKADSIKIDQKTLSEIDQAYVSLENQVKTQYGLSIREFRGLNEKYY